MIIDCIGCLHGHYPKMEGGDLLIVTGDLTATDLENEHALFDYWINEQPYKKKVVIAGNHDNVLEEGRLKFQFCDYLCDSGTEFEGLKIWGSPWTAQFDGINPKCCAFTENFGCDSDEWLYEHWCQIPPDTDILITHSPPFDIFDKVDEGKRLTGSGTLLIKSMDLKPKLHVFSHIHEEGGKSLLFGQGNKKTWFVNCSIMNEHYKPVHKPVRIIL